MRADFETYQEFVTAGAIPHNRGLEREILGAFGLSGEAGEVAEIFKKHLLHHKPLDHSALIKEMGDVLWYFTLILADYGITLDQVIEGNVRKLVARHGRSETWIDLVMGGDAQLTSKTQ